MRYDEAESTTHGNILMVVVVVIIAAILLALLFGFLTVLQNNESLAPPYIQIISVNHGTKYESQI